MDNYVTGAAIKSLREAKRLTQEELAERIHVSAKAVSKWETGKGFPDISLLEPLAKALDVSVKYGVTIAFSDIKDVEAGFHLRYLYTGNDVELP